MYSNIDIDRHHTGTFKILDEELTGDLVYNKKNGTILLSLTKPLSEETFLGKSYGSLDVIVGKLSSGIIVTLFNNRCVNNHTHAFHMQQLIFAPQYMIWSDHGTREQKYNKLVCQLENAYAWSRFTLFETTEFPGWKLKELLEKKDLRMVWCQSYFFSLHK